MKYIAGVFVAALLLSGCSTSDAEQGSDYSYIEVNTPGGGVVPCVIYDSGSYAGGISCKW